MNVLV